MNQEQTTYPLGHSPMEMNRLELQAKLFEDPLLLELANRFSSCLEIGCGVGSNLPLLRNSKETLRYHGIDLSSDAITAAAEAYGSHLSTFATQDASDLPQSDETFDLVFSKLVLWSMGSSWKRAVSEALRVLKPGGIFYAFEPYDASVVFEPKKSAFQAALNHWGEKASESGVDLCIGPKIPAELKRAGFRNVQTKFFPVLAFESDIERYQAISENLLKFYFGDQSQKNLAGFDPQMLEFAKEELLAAPAGLVMDAFFVTWGEK